MSSESSNLTSQLNAARGGDRAAAEQALGQVYGELKRMAGGILRGNPLTFDATSLVHDAFLRLIPESERQFADRRHFFRLAARAMRQILVDRARARGADKRGGGMEPLTLSHAEGIDADTPEVLDLDVALNQLDEIDGALRELVELRVFAGLTLQQIADTSGRSLRSVNRDWQRARALLLAQMD